MPKNDISYGKSLIKAHKRKTKFSNDGYRHSCDLPDGEDSSRLNLKSITEQTTLQEFLETASLEETDYKSDTKIVKPDSSNGVLSEEQLSLISMVQDQNKEILSIPRRPPWDKNTSKEVLDAVEKEAFLVWRRKLVELQGIEYINLTPFEKNLEVWRQLWRVIEKSEILVQILDARNPLLFRCKDLELYVKEVDESKENVLLLNKADFLTESQRKYWCDYFEDVKIQIVFFSALQQMQTHVNENNASEVSSQDKTFDLSCINNSPDVLTRDELINFFKTLCKARKTSKGTSTVGLVGYPNVGKSSSLNAILLSKKVSVSATPGKTKHFQTFNINEDLCLCDCPGLVFPNFVSTKADMIVNGILPIDQLRDYNQPISLIVNVIPKPVLEATYSIFIIPPPEGRDPNSPPTPDELLNPYGFNRGYMTENGLPDNSRSARYVLKDFVNGKLLYCHAPPKVNQEDYHIFPEIKAKKISSFKLTSLSESDIQFFSKMHVKGNSLLKESSTLTPSVQKPWRKHNNKNKHEKLRRLYKNGYD